MASWLGISQIRISIDNIIISGYIDLLFALQVVFVNFQPVDLICANDEQN
jgi:hypothetical protein